MNNSAYLSLIDDTLTYLRGLLPKAPPSSVKHAEVKPPKKIAPKIKVVPPPAAKPPPQKKVVQESGSFKFEPPSTKAEAPTESIRKLLLEIDPNLFLHSSAPSDIQAKRIKESWREKRDTPTIPILFQGDAYRPFIKNIAKAIDITFGTCRVVEVEAGKQWDLFLQSPNLKFVIVPDHIIFASKELLPFYKENPQEKTRHLGDIPLLLLPDLSLYYKDPYLKRSLWNVITKNLQPLF